MVRTRSMTASLRSRNPIKRKAAPRKRKAASSSEKMKRVAASAVDVDKILRLKKEIAEARETKCFRLPSGAEEEEIPEKKKKKKRVVKYLVDQAHIDHLKAGHFHGVKKIPEDELAKESQLFRDGYRAKLLLSEKVRAWQQVLIDQYDAFGYAYEANEVTDDEGDGDGVQCCCRTTRPEVQQNNGDQ